MKAWQDFFLVSHYVVRIHSLHVQHAARRKCNGDGRLGGKFRAHGNKIALVHWSFIPNGLIPAKSITFDLKSVMRPVPLHLMTITTREHYW